MMEYGYRYGERLDAEGRLDSLRQREAITPQLLPEQAESTLIIPQSSISSTVVLQPESLACSNLGNQSDLVLPSI
jgi:hypothetical protein